jgi:hypothetical protein
MTDDNAHIADEPMDGNDPFEAELQAMFDEATPAEDPLFTQQVMGALGKPDRTRLLALGGAGATGSAVAGTQLETIISGPLSQMSGVAGQAASFMGPEAIVSGLFAVLALGVVWIVPKGRLAI